MGLKGLRKGDPNIESPTGYKELFFMPPAPEIFPTPKTSKPPISMQESQAAHMPLHSSFKVALDICIHLISAL